MGRVIVAVDPGSRFTGWAKFQDKQLVSCGLVKAKGLDEMLPRCQDFFGNFPNAVAIEAVIERPQVYTQRKMKGDANDLITIALIGGYIGAFFLRAEFMMPRTWKGTVDKDVMCRRVENRWMNDRERGLLYNKNIPKGQVNNTLDAIGVGMYHLGRNR